VKKLFHHKTFVYATLLFWLFASASGMHGHYCFDGAEPPVSVHFDMMDGHDAEHDSLNTTHVDVDNNPSQTNAIKSFNLDLPFLALALLLVFVWPIVRSQFNYLSNTPSSWLSVTGLRPPLRAPPKKLH
jgi:hypothetical protein